VQIHNGWSHQTTSRERQRHLNPPQESL
jgi:hypothetical protein